MNLKDKISEYGRPIAVALIVVAAIVGISIASNNSSDNTNKGVDSSSVATDDNETTNDSQDSDNDNGETESATDEQIGRQPSAGRVTLEKSDSGYKTTARKGDNQTVMVREIVNEHLSDVEEGLNAAQRLYMETLLVNEIGRDNTIPIGYEVALTKDKVSQLASEAAQLSDAAQARWAQYL